MAELGTANIGGRAVPAWVLESTAEEIDDSKWFSRPNLLDNWYFANPVDQKKGKIIQSGVNIYTDSTFGTLIGPAAYACPVVELTSTYAKVQDAKNTSSYYYVPPADVVRGYVGLSDSYDNYVLDRWRVENNIVVTFESDGVSLENVGNLAGQYKQELPHDFFPEGTLLCISAIVKSVSGDARLFLSQSSSPFGHPVDFISLLQPGLYSGFGNLLSGNHKFSIYLGAGAKIKLAAAKLELGQTQTLAHQENGVWVFNEMPEEGEQLRRCLRYDYILGIDGQNCPVGIGTAYSTDGVICDIQLPEYMRANPAVSLSGGGVHIRFSATQNLVATSVLNYGFSGDKVQLYFPGLSGLTPGQSCDLYTETNSKLEFNSNL